MSSKLWKKKSMWNSSSCWRKSWVCACWVCSCSGSLTLYTLYGTRVSTSGLFICISLELESLRLNFLHWTRASNTRNTSLLKCFKNMPTNEIVAKIMFKWKISLSLKGRKDNVASYLPWNFANSNPIINPIPQTFYNT